MTLPDWEEKKGYNQRGEEHGDNAIMRQWNDENDKGQENLKIEFMR